MSDIDTAAEAVIRTEAALNELNNQLDVEKDIEKRVDLGKKVANKRVEVRKARQALATAIASA